VVATIVVSHFWGDFWGVGAKSSTGFSLRWKDGQNGVRYPIAELKKRLHIFAGFDDYPIATRG